MSKNFDETVCLLPKKIRVDTRDKRRDYKGLQRAQAALSVWPAHLPLHSLGETSVWEPIVA